MKSNFIDQAFEILDKSQLFSEDSLLARQMLSQHPHPIPAARAMINLIQCNFYTREKIFNLIAQTTAVEKLWTMDTILLLMKENYLLGEQAGLNFESILQHDSPYSITYTFIAIDNYRLLHGEYGNHNRAMVLEHSNRDGLIKMCERLELTSLLDRDNAQMNFELILAHQNLNKAISLIKILFELESLTQDNFVAAMNLKHPQKLMKVYQIFDDLNLFESHKKALRFQTAWTYVDLLSRKEIINELRRLPVDKSAQWRSNLFKSLETTLKLHAHSKLIQRVEKIKKLIKRIADVPDVIKDKSIYIKSRARPDSRKTFFNCNGVKQGTPEPSHRLQM